MSLVAALWLWPNCVGTAFSQKATRPQSEELGWDLSYKRLLRDHRVGPDTWLAKWLKQTKRGFTRKLLASWRGKRITASALIECPAPHAAEHVVVLLIRTKKGAYLWQAVDKGEAEPEKRKVDPKLMDGALRAIAAWRQAKPSPPKERPRDREELKVLSGYLGVLNYHDSRASRQRLLVYDDLFPDGGRLSKVLKPLLK
jgi:hypothetical protein